MADGGKDKVASTAKEEPFKKVPTRRKRKQDEVEGMETGEAAKRPNFPPVAAESLKVKLCYVACAVYLVQEPECSASQKHISEENYFVMVYFLGWKIRISKNSGASAQIYPS